MCNFYMMYYTDASRGDSYIQCINNQIQPLPAPIPADSDTPLPPNPELEDIAQGVHHYPGKDPDYKTPMMPESAAREDSGFSRNSYFPNRAQERSDYHRFPAGSSRAGYPNYDYYDQGNVEPANGGQDYFYYSVGRQRNRNRRPHWSPTEPPNYVPGHSFFDFNEGGTGDDESNYWEWQNERSRGPMTEEDPRMAAYDIVKEQQHGQNPPEAEPVAAGGGLNTKGGGLTGEGSSAIPHKTTTPKPPATTRKNVVVKVASSPKPSVSEPLSSQSSSK